MIDPSGNNLLFLLSTPRAGSTLLSVMLGHHSSVHSPNEPWFLLPLLGMYGEHSAVVTPYDQKVASVAMKEMMEAAEFNEAARAFALQVYNNQLKKAGKTILLDKTPRYYYVLPSIQELFPAAKKIWLKRNPLDVAASFVSTWNVPLAELIVERFTPSSFDLTISFLKFLRFFHGQPGTYELRYEDLVIQPEKHLADLCAFIGIKPETNLHDYSGNDTHLDTLRRTSMGDKKVLAHSKPHQLSIDQWKKVLSREEVQLFLRYTGRRPFERMGYGDTLKFLKSSGYSFPDEPEVDDRWFALEERARAFPYKMEQFLKDLRRHWWIKLGRRLGVCRLSSI